MFTEGDNYKLHVYVCRYVFVCDLSFDISGCDMKIDWLIGNWFRTPFYMFIVEHKSIDQVYI